MCSIYTIYGLGGGVADATTALEMMNTPYQNFLIRALRHVTPGKTG